MITGCPTALLDSEVRLMRRICRDRRVVEAGALLGYSTIQLAQVAASVTSIDKHCDYSGDTWNRYRSNLYRANVAHRVRPLRGDVLDWLSQAEGDVGFIDLTGKLELTLAAMRAIRTPLVMVHDWGRGACQVEEAIKASGYRVVESADTLVVCEKEI